MADMDLDALFDDALDDLESSSQWQQVGKNPVSANAPTNTSTTTTTTAETQSNTQSHTSTDNAPKPDTTTTSTNDPKASTEESKEPYLDMIDEALQSVTESVQQAQNAQASNAPDDNMMEFFNQLLTSFNDDHANPEGGGEEALDNMLKKMMSNFFTVDTIQEPIQIIAQKYPVWLDKNRDSLSESELANHTEQCNLYVEANEMLKAESPNMDKIMDILTQTFAHGSLPAEVMDGMMPEELAGFAEQLNQLEKNADEASTTTPDNKESDSKENNDATSADTNAEANAGGEDPMKMFQEFMAMMNTEESAQNTNTDAHNSGGTGNVAAGMPKLSPEEMKQFQELMKADGCSIM